MCCVPEREFPPSSEPITRGLTYQQSEKMEYLEKTQSWKEEEFDVVLQFMRTILLRRKQPPLTGSAHTLLTE